MAALRLYPLPCPCYYIMLTLKLLSTSSVWEKGLPSWRRIIHELHWYDALSMEHSLGDSIVHYAEELTGK